MTYGEIKIVSVKELDDDGNGMIDEGVIGINEDADNQIDEDGEACPHISINDVSSTEGDSGTENFDFTITRSSSPAAIANPSSVDFATIDDTATASSDYSSNTGTVNFA